jgi:putative ABC transport system ATP-binding protein
MGKWSFVFLRDAEMGLQKAAERADARALKRPHPSRTLMMNRLEAAPCVVDIRRVRRTFSEGDHERVVLDGVDLQLERGAFAVLLGRSGSGKSTLLNIISGIDLPTEGTVRLDGVDLTHRSERDRTLFRREHIGFVFQAYNLIPTLSVEENILLPLELNGRRTKHAVDRAFDILREVGLADRRQTFPDRLSGGEQQRVAIARALAHDPSLLLADEPTGNLDDDTAARVLELFDSLVRSWGKTTLIATHDRSMRAMADRVFVLQGGTVTVHEPAESI